MIKFAQLLSGHIKRKKANITQMAMYVDIQRTNLYKMKTGERLPKDQEIVKKMAKYLNLDFNDTKELLDAYEIESIGEFIYFRRNDIKDFLKKTDIVNPNILDDTRPMISLINDYTPIENIQVVRGANNLFHVMKKIIIDDCSNADKPVLNLICQPFDMRVISILKTAYAINKETIINHIFCLDNSENIINYQTYNIKCLTNIFSLLLVTNKYVPLYYYNQISLQDAKLSLFSNVLISKKYVLVFTDDFEHGIIYTDDNSKNIYTRMFEIYKKKTNKLLKLLDYEKYCLLYTSGNVFSKRETLLFTTPCPTYTVNASDCFAEKHLKENFPYRKEFIQFYNEYLVMYNECLKSKLIEPNLYFTVQGLEYFTRTGYFQDVPPMLFIPLDLEERIIILQRWREFVSSYANVHMLDLPEYPESSMVSLIIAPEKTSFTTYTANGELIFIQSDEASIATAFYDYFQSIVTTRCCSLEKTLAAIEDCINDLIRQKNSQ